MAQGNVNVYGYREFVRACNRAEKETRNQAKATLARAGEIVRPEAARLFSGISPVSAAGFRTAVRTRGVAVEQRKKRVTGARGDYGALQMRRALLPALQRNEERVVREFEDALDEIERIMERG